MAIGVSLYDFQVDALHRMKNGCILNGGVGSGKSRTSLAYYYTLFGGKINTSEYVKMKDPCDLYIITTAIKRDTFEWEDELKNYRMFIDQEKSTWIYKHKIVIDSWNNIKKYSKVKDSFFIFDEQRVVGYGAWTQAFLTIAKNNRWILLSATPGDTWSDYIPVFIANGFYKNKWEFERKHCVFSRYTLYPKIEKYYDLHILLEHKRSILVEMKDPRTTIEHHETINVEFDRSKYFDVVRERWNPFKNKPIEKAAEYCQVLRHIVNEDLSRLNATLDILKDKKKAIIFYSYDYELEALRNALKDAEFPFSEWNGHKHEMIINGPEWAYLVEYTAGAEGWNCTSTDTVIFYSQNYSYRVMIQSAGRINRMNTPYKDLYFYHLKSKAPIDNAIEGALKRKKKFNEARWAPDFVKK